jgi:hypothetical protein
MKRYLNLLVFICLCTTSRVFATDLTVKSIDIPAEGAINEPFGFKITISNIREYPAELYRVTLTVRDKFNQFCYGDTVTGIDFPAHSDRDHTFKPWTTQYAGDYRAIVRVTYMGDVNPANDESTKNFNLVEEIEDPMDREDAIDLIIGSLVYDQIFKGHIQWHVPPGFIPAGTSIVQTLTKPGATPYDTVAKLIADSWVGYFNSDKYARYGHAGTVVVLDPKDSAITKYPVRSAVMVGDQLLGDPFNTATLVDGTVPQVLTGSTNSITNEVQTANPHDSTIVILVSGKPSDAKEGRGFKQDVEFMDLNLRLERDGPRIPQSAIRKLDNPSPADILGMLDTLKGKYNRIIFFYSGHGDSLQKAGDPDLGWMVTRDSALAYWKLFQGLYETGAKDLEIIIDACHSGTAISDIEYDERYKDRNITLITAASPGRVSYTNYYAPETKDTVGVGAFTFAFVQAFGNTSAESDGVAGTSFVEAFQWTRIFGKDYAGRWLDTLLDPRIYIHRAQTRKDTATSAGSHVSITPTATMSETDVIRTSMVEGPPTIVSVDASVSFLSTGRYWSIENKGIKADYQFYVSPLWDSIPPGQEPTMLQLNEGSTSWTAYDSVKYLSGSTSIMAYGVDFSAKWAIGVTVPQQGSVSSETMLLAGSLLAPNPATHFVELTFQLAEARTVSIELVDVSGRSLGLIHSTKGLAGSNSIRLDLPPVSAGGYLLRMTAGDHVQLLKLQID